MLADNRIHIDKNFNYRSAINRNYITIAGLKFNNVIYQGEFIDENNKFVNSQYVYFAYYDKANISTMINNHNVSDLNNLPGYYYWGSQGGIYTAMSGLGKLNTGKNYYFYPSLGFNLNNDTNLKTSLPKISYDSSNNLKAWKFNNTKSIINRYTDNSEFTKEAGKVYFLLAPCKDGTADSQKRYRLTQANRPFRLPLPAKMAGIGFSVGAIYKENKYGETIAPFKTVYKANKEEILTAIVHTPLIKKDATFASDTSAWLWNGGRFNPFYYYDNQWKNISEQYGKQATQARLQSRFAGFNAPTMKNLVDYWKTPSSQQDSAQITLRGKNDFGLDLVQVVVGDKDVFRISASGDVLINGQQV